MPTKIEWTDETWNPVTGCTKVSEACANCYAERMFGRRMWHSAFEHIQTHPTRLNVPLHWRRPRKIFLCSMGDLFHPEVPFDFIDAVWAVMALAGQHTFQVLTKRPERMREWEARSDRATCVKAAALALGYSLEYQGISLLPRVLPNVWLGATVENMKRAPGRIHDLLMVPAAVHFISGEPLLEALNLCELPNPTGPGTWDVLHGWKPAVGPEGANTPRLDWVIAGGETGARARPTELIAFRFLRDQCERAGVPFFLKQITEHGSKVGCALDGREWKQFPGEAAR